MTKSVSAPEADHIPWNGSLLERSVTLAVVFLLLLLFLPAAYFLHSIGSGLSPDRQQWLREVEIRRSAWQEKQPDNFQYIITRSCFCGGAITAPFKVVERNGSARLYAPEQISAAHRPDVISIEDVFDILERAIREADRVRVTYEAEYGYPLELQIDWYGSTVDDEDRYRITDFAIIQE